MGSQVARDGAQDTVPVAGRVVQDAIEGPETTGADRDVLRPELVDSVGEPVGVLLVAVQHELAAGVVETAGDEVGAQDRRDLAPDRADRGDAVLRIQHAEVGSGQPCGDRAEQEPEQADVDRQGRDCEQRPDHDAVHVAIALHG